MDPTLSIDLILYLLLYWVYHTRVLYSYPRVLSEALLYKGVLRDYIIYRFVVSESAQVTREA
jgi:hypothetical protein